MHGHAIRWIAYPPEADVNIVNVAVMAPILGADLSYVTDVDGRVRALDANEAIRDSRHGSPARL